jgi:uncharacterized membrane protein
MPKELITMIIAALPLTELRGAIPAAVIAWDIPIARAFIFAIIGNFLPVIPLILFWNFLAEKLSDRFYYCNRLFAWLSDRTMRNHAYKFEKWESLALLLFVALPFPLTGAWSGTLAAFLFGIPMKKSAMLIGVGIVISGLIVSFLTKTGSEILSVI